MFLFFSYSKDGVKNTDYCSFKGHMLNISFMFVVFFRGNDACLMEEDNKTAVRERKQFYKTSNLWSVIFFNVN